ncbi:MAG: chromate efflux transporter [Bacteroidota bacterium]
MFANDERSPRTIALFWSFAKIGAFTIGGGYAMIPLIRAELVHGRHWLSDQEFAEILGLAQTAPGAIAVNTSILAGYRLRRLSGALAACLGAVLPSFLIILIVAAFFGQIRGQSLVDKVFRGMRPAIVGLIAAAVLSMGRSLLRSRPQWIVAVVLFILTLSADPHPVFVIALAGLIGYCLPGHQAAPDGRGQMGAVLPTVALSLAFSFFVIGSLTFGGGYAMIPLIQRVIISERGWLTTQQFLEIVAIAEMTPGPIAINSATFVGYRVGGLLGSAAATLGVVLPSLLLVLALASVFYRYRDLPAVQRVAAGLRTAVVALIAAAVVTVGRASIHTWLDAAVAGAVVALLRGTRIHPLLVLLGAAGAGAVLY